MCIKITFFTLEDQRSWRQFKIGKVPVHFHLILISSHCRGEKPYWQCKKHTDPLFFLFLVLIPLSAIIFISFVWVYCLHVYHCTMCTIWGNRAGNLETTNTYNKILGLGRLWNLVETHQQQPPGNPSYLFYKSELRRWVCCIRLNE